ncbi:glycyl-radical enzyme activating protein [Olsenella massiliensis]|uniref:glycyl-radical enzyme activating protein n=1 Tax=Olsenella massiliensis TaxID=1622075 RepID=UPI00071D8DCE|nr:glycyl-radical enzyme activating protein [Olsenella massiliensis]
MQHATVFNMQKFSLNDGPGIRTVVFLKGCPLRCFWCSNPESQRREPQLEWKEGACIGCGHCIELLPHAGTSVVGGKAHVDVRHADATTPAAEKAVEECPGKALSIAGETKTVDEVLEFCLQDKPFYEESGGGVTLSGGEAMLWPEFDIELLSRLHEEGVDTCIETEAYVPTETFVAVAEHLDHMLIDMKHGDDAAHRRGTGGGIGLIHANIRAAVEMGKDVLVRTPVIPGFNDRTEDARLMARTLRELGLSRVQLLPFHNYGENKYRLLERDYPLHGVTALKPEDLSDYAAAYRDEGVEAFF